MTRRALEILIVSLMMIAGAQPVHGTRNKIADRGMAEAYCDTVPLQAVEGIWRFPGDETEVLIREIEEKRGEYDIIVVSTPDCRMTPGESIGKLKESGDQRKYEMRLYANKRGNILTDLMKCSAEIDRDGTRMSVKAPGIKLGVRNFYFLPKFWRMLRVKVDDPASELRDGMIRVYPRAESRTKIYYY